MAEEIITPPIINYEVKSQTDVIEKDITDLRSFAMNEIRRATTSRQEDELSDAAVHAQATSILNDLVKQKKELSLIFARDEAAELIGYRIVGFDSKPDGSKIVTDSFIGVKPDRRRQGIGLELLRRSIEIIRGQGITEYQTNSRVGAIALMRHLGLNITTEPIPDQSPEFAQRVTVHLE